jgi:NAD-dependent SIR2 family protein deacetylase
MPPSPNESTTPSRDALLSAARASLKDATALLVTAGAGMGVDSGLPDFRGNEGFWRAYPPFERLGLGFSALANPSWFHRDPTLAWGFYGHRKNLYFDTVPHAGFRMLREYGESLPDRYFVFTSNVDGQFQKAGFDPDRVVEAHGSIHHLQCVQRCGPAIWPSTERVTVDHETMRAADPFPTCPRCGGLARPNILMFGDGDWLEARSDAQEKRLDAWLDALSGPIVVVEMGAGTAIPTVRVTSEQVVARSRHGGTLIRINPRESHGPEGTLSFPEGALAGLAAIFRAS